MPSTSLRCVAKMSIRVPLREAARLKDLSRSIIGADASMLTDENGPIALAVKRTLRAAYIAARNRHHWQNRTGRLQRSITVNSSLARNVDEIGRNMTKGAVDRLMRGAGNPDIWIEGKAIRFGIYALMEYAKYLEFYHGISVLSHIAYGFIPNRLRKELQRSDIVGDVQQEILRQLFGVEPKWQSWRNAAGLTREDYSPDQLAGQLLDNARSGPGFSGNFSQVTRALLRGPWSGGPTRSRPGLPHVARRVQRYTVGRRSQRQWRRRMGAS